MNSRRYPRTMTEAFGPCTDNRLLPMRDPRPSLLDRVVLFVLEFFTKA